MWLFLIGHSASYARGVILGSRDTAVYKTQAPSWSLQNNMHIWNTILEGAVGKIVKERNVEPEVEVGKMD